MLSLKGFLCRAREEVFCAEPQRRPSILATDSFERAFRTELESRPSVTNHRGVSPYSGGVFEGPVE